MQINGRQIGGAHRPYIVAEMSANHNGKFDRAMAIIEAAAEAGADAIKFQLYDPKRLATARGGANKILLDGPWVGMSLLEIYEKAHTPLEWFGYMATRCEELGLTWFSSVFDPRDVPTLRALDCPAYKISSFDTANKTLLARVALLRKPTIISCGMADDEQIAHAGHVMRAGGGVNNYALLHCVSKYPTPLSDANFTRLDALRNAFRGVPVGFSDHTAGTVAPAVAVGRGACIVEKHLTLSRSDGGLDASFSVEPDELAEIVETTHAVWIACRGGPVAAPYRDLMVVS